MFGFPCCRMTGRTTLSGKSYHQRIVGVCRACYVAEDLPACPGGSWLCCEINFLTKKQSFLSCNPRLMSQHFTHQLFTTTSKKSNFQIFVGWRESKGETLPTTLLSLTYSLSLLSRSPRNFLYFGTVFCVQQLQT